MRSGPKKIEEVLMTTERVHLGGSSYRFTAIRERFGGVDTPAAVAGMLTAMGTFLLIGGVVAAWASTIDFQVDQLDAEGVLAEVSTIGVLVAVVALFISFLVGGWAAGRMARYDGGVNGAMTAMWMLLLVAVFAALSAWIGEEYNVFAAMDLPDWISVWDSGELTVAAIAGGLLGIVAMFLGGWLGGRMGEVWHRRVDAALATAAADGPAIPASLAHRVAEVDDRSERTVDEAHDIESRLAGESSLPPHPPV